jgi:nicotinate phosphoribosyltransferase
MARGLFADLYELTMARAYSDLGMADDAVFSLFVRKLPETRNFLIACGLDDLLDDIEAFRFSADDIAYLGALKMFPLNFLDALGVWRFTGDIFAVPEGAPVFAGEPLLEVVAPIGQGQVLETLILNRIGLQTVLASKAWRVVAAAAGKPVMDFGARRAQGEDAAVRGARAFAIGGVAGTSLLAAGARYGLKVVGTMAHSFVEAFASEAEAFAAFARIYPQTILLVDTYDSLTGVKEAIELAKNLGDDCRLTGIRLDSGNLYTLSRAARSMLDAAGLTQMLIVASGGLNEHRIHALVEANAPVDIFAVGTDMSVSADAPALDIAYKLTEYAGAGRMKLSPDKSTRPGQKQVFRRERSGVAIGDMIGRFDEPCEGTPLLVPVMRKGKRLEPPVEIDVLRERAARLIGRLPAELRSIEFETVYPVEVSERLQRETATLRDHYARQLRV